MPWSDALILFGGAAQVLGFMLGASEIWLDRRDANAALTAISIPLAKLGPLMRPAPEGSRAAELLGGQPLSPFSDDDATEDERREAERQRAADAREHLAKLTVGLAENRAMVGNAIKGRLALRVTAVLLFAGGVSAATVGSLL